MAAVIGALRADLSASVAGFENDMGRAAKAVQAFGKRAAAVSQNLEAAGQRMTIALTAPFIALAVTSAKAAAESNDALAQVESRLESMGGASGKSAKQLQESAKALQGLSTFDDDDIMRNVTNALLTFGRVSGEQFDRGQRAAVDMATSLKMDLQSAAVLVGKALNDPIKGITALGRAGVQLTNDQKASIRTAVEQNRIFDAQKIILGELETQFKGAGEAARSAVPGADAIDSWREFQETIGAVVLRVIEAVEPMVVRILDAFNSLSPGFQQAIVVIGAIVAAIGPLLWAFGAFAGALANLAPYWAAFLEGVSAAMSAAGVTGLGAVLRGIVATFAPWIAAIIAVVAAMWEFRAVIFDAFGSVVALFQAEVLPAFQRLFGAIGDLFTSLMTGPLGDFVRFVGWAAAEIVALFVKVAGGGIAMFVSIVVDTLANVITFVGNVVDVVNALIRGDWAGAWQEAVDLVTDAIDGILQVVEHLVPGVTDAARAAWQGFQQWVGEGIAGVLDWIEGRFPGLVDAVRAMAQGAVAWARSMFQGIKTWIADNLGPVINWAKDRIRELNSLFGMIRRRQAQVAGASAPAAAPAAPAARPAPPPPAGGDGGDGGGGAGGGRGGGRSGSDTRARDLARAAERLEEGLETVNDSIDKAFARDQLPRSMQQAADLRAKLEDLATEARAAGVDMTAFAAGMATAQQRIRELELEGLAKEAEEFRREVMELARDVIDLGGGLPPLESKLQTIDDRFESLRREIVEQIDANRALAGANVDAAAAMAVLERQLGSLDAAHQKATESAKAQHAAEQRLFDLQAAADAAGIEQDIRDATQASGRGGIMAPGQAELQAIEDDLVQQRTQAAIELAALESEYTKAEAEGDQAQMGRLQTQIGLQQRLFDLVSSTTAEQIQGHQRIQDAFDEFASSAADGFAQLVTDWKGGLDTLKQSFAKLIIQLLQAQAAKGITSIFSKFAGGFATGGTLAAGQWGIAGENGPEPIFAGASSLGVMSNEDAFGGGKGTIYIDARGAGPREIDELRGMVARMDRGFEARVVSASNEGLMRGKIKPPSFG